MKSLIWVLLFVVCTLVVLTTREPKNFRTLKHKYVEYIKDLPEEFRELSKPSLLTGTTRKGHLGSNVNKGYEISICTQGDVNSMFHVLLHELAHCTVDEYKHSDEFWSKFDRLKSDAISRGFYQPIQGATEFCGKKIND